MANCNSCGRVVFPGHSKCECGAKIYRSPAQTFDRPAKVSNLSAEVARRFGQKINEVNAYIEAHKNHNPHATKREGCLAYLKAKGLYGNLPDSLKREADAEARLEREALQAQ